MRRERTPWLRRFLTGLALAAGLGSSGCVPGVGWLPDSSGIIYTGGKKYDRLIHYDLAGGKEKVLVADTGAPTMWPAVSPDGTKVAVAKVSLEGKNRATVQVVLYDRNGKELKRSKVFPWVETPKGPGELAPGKEDKPLAPQLFWAPRGERVVVHLTGYSGIYDVKDDRFINLKDGLVLTFGGTPFRPDGTGFLVMRNVNNWLGDRKKAVDHTPRFALVDFDGKEQAIKPPPLLLDDAALEKETDLNKLIALLNPVLYQSGWEADVAHVSWNVDRLRYYTKKGEAVIDRIKPQTTADGLVVQYQHRFASGARARMVSLHAPKKQGGESTKVRVELLKPGQDEGEVILPRADACVPLASPNGKLLALRCLMKTNNPKQQQESILIVNDKGERTANLQVPR
jgi:hypothetical protein